MRLVRKPRRAAASVSVSPLISLLALAALLFAVFAIHSEATGHAMHDPVHSSLMVAGAQDPVVVTAAMVTAPVVAVTSSGTMSGMLLDCALLALTCVLLLTLVVMVFLTRLPAVYQRLLDAGGIILGKVRASAFPIHRPSLTVLSISRI